MLFSSFALFRITRVIAILCLVLLAVVVVSDDAGAFQDYSNEFKELFEADGNEGFLDDMDSFGTGVVTTIRAVATIMTVLLVISVGVTLWFATDERALSAIKARIVMIVVGLFLIFFAGPTARLILDLFN